MIRFNLEKLKAEDPTDSVIFSTIYQGIFPEELVMKKLAQRQADNLKELLDKVEEFINEEETLKAMKLAWKLPKKFEDKKKKDHRREDEPKPFKKRFSDYDFTPLNANIYEVLMEVKKDPEYRKPSRIAGAPLSQNQD